MKRKGIVMLLLPALAVIGIGVGFAAWTTATIVNSNTANRIVYSVEFDGYKDSSNNNVVYNFLDKTSTFELPQLDDHVNEHFLGWYVNGCNSMAAVTSTTTFDTLLTSAIAANSSYTLSETTSGNVTTRKMILNSKFGIKDGYTLFTVSANSGVTMDTYYLLTPTTSRFYLFNLKPVVSGYHLESYTYAGQIAKWDMEGNAVAAPGSGNTTIYPNESISLTGITSIALTANFEENS